MLTISFINMKGGVGKTTMSVHTAYALAEYMDSAKVLFIDSDPQGNSSDFFDADPTKPNFAHLLMRKNTTAEVIQHTRFKNIDIIPSDLSGINAKNSILLDKKRSQHDILQKALKKYQDKYHLCIIDSPPAIDMVITNCFYVTDHIIAVTLPNMDSFKGIIQLQSLIDEYNENLYKDLKISGVLLNQAPRKDNSFIEKLEQPDEELDKLAYYEFSLSPRKS